MSSPDSGSCPTTRGRLSRSRACSRVTVDRSMERRRLAVRGLGLAALVVFFVFAVFAASASAVSSGSGRTSVT